jgi:predicted dinucleotide-binding enzyme
LACGQPLAVGSGARAKARDRTHHLLPAYIVGTVRRRVSSYILEQWDGKIVVDVTNALDATSGDLGGRLSSDIVAEAFVGARLVKAFNHLPAEQLGTNPSQEPQVIFVSSNDEDASIAVAAVATQLGFAPVQLGKIDQGGVPLHALDRRPGGLLFQDLVKTG